MNITYTYEIISVDQDARCMEVVYASEGNPTLHIGARLPFEGETVEDVVAMYAPIIYWKELQTPLLPVIAGQTGSLVAALPAPYSVTVVDQAIAHRNDELLKSDWTQLSNAPLTDEQKTQWAIYRQALRDVTEQPGFPGDIVWPVKPGIYVTTL